MSLYVYLSNYYPKKFLTSTPQLWLTQVRPESTTEAAILTRRVTKCEHH